MGALVPCRGIYSRTPAGFSFSGAQCSRQDSGQRKRTIASGRRYFSQCAPDFFAALETLHRYNVVFADLSTSNIIVEETTGKLKLIDFEGAWESGKDQAGMLYTPGFVSQNRLAGGEAAIEDDYYAAGAVLMSLPLSCNRLFPSQSESRPGNDG